MVEPIRGGFVIAQPLDLHLQGSFSLSILANCPKVQL